MVFLIKIVTGLIVLALSGKEILAGTSGYSVWNVLSEMLSIK